MSPVAPVIAIFMPGATDRSRRYSPGCTQRTPGPELSSLARGVGRLRKGELLTKRKPRPVPGAPGPLRVPPRILVPSPSATVVVTPRRWPKVLVLVAAAAVLVAAAVFTATSMLGSGAGGGSRTPEEAVAKFVASANDADVLGVLDSLLPLERSSWQKPMQQLFIDGRRLQLIPNTADVESVQGLTLDLHTAMEPADLVAPDVAAVSVGGSVSSSVEVGGANPIGSEERAVNLRIAAVRSGARWYVSVWHTVAENLRFHSTRALTWPAPESAVFTGAATPIDAVSDLLSAVARFSLGDLVALLDPEQASVLQRVAPWFVPGTQQAIDEVVRRGGLELRLSDPEFMATTKGNNAVVTFSGLQAVVKSNHLSIAIHDNCGVFSNYGEADTRQCLSDASGTRESLSQELLRLGLEPSLIRGVLLYDDLRRAVEGLSGVGVAVHNVGGRWYVNPTATVTTLLVAALGESDRALGATMAEDLRSLITLLTGSGAAATGSGTASGTGASGATGPAGEPGAVDTYGRYNECRSLDTFEAAKACIETGILGGDIDRDAVDGSFLYPECGWRGSRFDPSLPAMSNAAYISLAKSAAACLQAKIDAGLLLSVQMPFELIRTDCLKGMNPSRMGSDTANEYLRCQYGDE